MSVLIKGMKMPEKCGSCDLFHVESPMHCTVVKGHKTVGAPYGMPRPDWCPLVEVKEPHGRLIDEENVIDAIHERLKVLQTHEVFRRKRGDIDLLEVMPYIAKIPTVIEAEGSENE